MKKLLSILLCVIVILGIAPLYTNALVYTGICGEDLKWEYDSVTCVLTVTGHGDMYDYAAPTTRAPWWNYRDEIKEVIIDEGVTSVGQDAFRNLAVMTKVTFPQTLKKIGYRAFSHDYMLVTALLPDSVDELGKECFYLCEEMKYCRIPDGVTEVPEKFMYGCEKVEELTIPDSVEALYNFSLSCLAITEIVIPDSVTYIGANVFQSCTKLAFVTMSKNLQHIGSFVFDDTAWYTAQKGHTIIFNDILYKCREEIVGEYRIPDGIRTVAIDALAYQEQLTNVVFPPSCTYIMGLAFLHCPLMTTLYIPDTVTKIDSKAFGYVYDYLYEPITGFSISGHGGSAAEAFANENGFAFFCQHEYETTEIPKIYCDEQGCTRHTCKYCQKSYDENIIAPTTHSFSEEWTVDIAATCVSAGEMSHHCTICAARTDITAIEKGGHDFSVKYTLDRIPTCAEAGQYSRHCNLCDEVTDAVLLPKTAHTSDGVREDVLAPTCTEAGASACHCTVCGETCDEMIVPATGHTAPDDWETVIGGTALDTKLYVKKCTVCGTVLEYNVVEPTISRGDTNTDGKINSSDILVLRTIVSGIQEVDEDTRAAADVDNNGKINSTDVLALRLMVST